MWLFSPATKKADDVELPANNQEPQTNIDPTVTPSTNSQQHVIQSQDAPAPQYRLGMPPLVRIQYMAGLASLAGFLTGLKEGADVAGLCFRAENAHLTPTSKAGWFLYNKSKNYHMVLGGARQGVKTGAKYFGLTTLFITIEHGIDAARGRLFASRKEKENDELRKGQADFLNTISAAVAVAGIHSWWTRMDRFAAARMTRGAVMFAVPFGLGQDLVGWASGNRTWYIEGVYRLFGAGSPENQGASLQREARRI